MAKKKQELSSEELLAEALVREEDWPYEVPGNWVWVRLGSVCSKVQYGYTAKSTHDKIGPKLLRITDIKDSFVNWESVPYCEITPSEFKKFSLDKDDIVVARTGATTGKSFLISENVEAVFASYLIRVNLNRDFNVKYLYDFMQSNLYWSQIMDLSQGIAQPGVNATKLQNMFFPLPPLAEQQRIVDRIESLFDKLDQAKELIQEALDSFENRKAAILHQAFTGQLTKKWREAHGVGMESWEEKILGETDIQIIDGDRGKNYPKKNEFTNKGYCLYLNTKNVTKNGFVFQELQFISKEKDEILRKGKLQREDIILTTRGTIGNIAYYDLFIPFEDIRIDSGMVIFRGGSDFYKPFLCHLFKSEYITNQISSLKTGSAQPQLPINIMKNLNLVIPSIKEQQEIVRILDDLFSKEQNAKDLCDLIDQIEAMKKTILGKAFRGELGTNEAGEESALELLKKVLTKES